MTHRFLLSPLITFLLFSQIVFSQTNDNKTNTSDLLHAVLDIDGNSYETVRIGEQTWMKENLRVSKLNDGTPITNITSNSGWSSNTKPAYCWYNNNETDFKIPYGALYNWEAVNTGKLCPSGWRVPSKSDWEELIDYIGGEGEGGKLKVTGTNYWESFNDDATNETGFSAVQAGERYSDGAFQYHAINNNGGHSEIWSKDLNTAKTNEAWSLRLHPFPDAFLFSLHIDYGASCRCIKDDNTSSSKTVILNDEVVSIYPNPSKEKVFINIDNNKSNNAILTISNIQGKQVYNARLESNVFDISNFEFGVYILHIFHNESIYVRKILKE